MLTTNRSAGKTDGLATLSPIFAFIKPYKAMVFAALCALSLTALINLSIGQGVKFVIDSGFISGSSTQLKQSLLILMALISLLTIGTFCRFYLMSWIGERVSADIRQAVFTKIITLHPSYFEENRSGEIMSRLTTDTALLQSIIGSSLSMALRSILVLIGGLIMLMVTNWSLTIWVIACVPLILVPMLVFGRNVRNLSADSQDAIADIGSYAGEIIQNIKVVQSYSQENNEQQAFSNEVEKAFNVAKRRIKQRSFLIAIVIFLTFAAISIMLWVGGMDVLSGAMTGGELGAFVFYAVIVAMSVATISEVYGELQRAVGAATRLLALLDVESLIKSPEKSDTVDNDKDITAPRSIISFDNVSFSYPSRPDTPALKNINLQVKQGQVIALVGPSGAGKTTLFELLQRFYDPQEGTVLLRDISLTKLALKQVRSSMGMVPQQPVLFSQDVMHNIRYGKPDASDDEVISAAKLAHAHEFILQLPQGYQSFLGEQGVRLSGGQKQRVALARAILKDPELLLLDEATSALDAESEHHVQIALQELMHDRTTLIIAHRLSTVINADLILLMNNGEIIAQGNHLELYKSSTLYKRLCELQFDSVETAL